MKSGLIRKLTDPGEIGIKDELLAMPEGSLQMNYISVLINLIGFIIGFILIKNRFDDRIGCFLWYVVLPCLFNIISVTFYRIFFRRTKNRAPGFYETYNYIIPGAHINLFAYSYIVVIYRSIPQVWIIGFMPLLLACYYKGTGWFKVQAVLQGLFLGLMLVLRDVRMPYDFDEPSHLIKGIFFALTMLQFAHGLLGQDNLKRSIYAGISVKEAKMEVRRVFEDNLSNDCQPYLDTIERAAYAILENDEDEGVHEYAKKLVQAGEELKEAVGEVRE